jgi:hypothetical protein
VHSKTSIRKVTQRNKATKRGELGVETTLQTEHVLSEYLSLILPPAFCSPKATHKIDFIKSNYHKVINISL